MAEGGAATYLHKNNIYLHEKILQLAFGFMTHSIFLYYITYQHTKTQTRICKDNAKEDRQAVDKQIVQQIH